MMVGFHMEKCWEDPRDSDLLVGKGAANFCLAIIFLNTIETLYNIVCIYIYISVCVIFI